LIGLLDLVRIAASEDAFDIHALLDRAHRFGLALPLTLATSAARSLWPEDPFQTLEIALNEHLRAPERMVRRRATQLGLDAIPTASVVLARLLSGRPSRAGWRTIPRRVWCHPGVVASETPTDWPWLRRRGTHVLQQIGLRKP
jgi:hypothetical protein